MWAHFARLALVTLSLGLFLRGAQAGDPFVPSWIKNDPAAKTVTMEIVADWSVVARYAKGNVRTDITDFNGYWGGNLTIRVPIGWSVRITFINHASVFLRRLRSSILSRSSPGPTSSPARGRPISCRDIGSALR